MSQDAWEDIDWLPVPLEVTYDSLPRYSRPDWQLKTLFGYGDKVLHVFSFKDTSSRKEQEVPAGEWLLCTGLTELIASNTEKRLVIVERYPGEKHLKSLDRTKFLVPQDVIVSHFITIIRNRLALTPNQAFYLVVKNKSLSNMYTTIAELDQEYKDSDGFLYISYASQEMFGANWPGH
ncbi:microtubule-associated proteins 1A/1B light chain 3A-like [Stegostoma tigrinum]|uniref:microtubule-associated proteins 1A/1B light chain 3A-like n=1 Tax=Stegostoma tigrinum TaxID=3053191 RepID=UPI0028703BCC|nr:microtubule-associated proteins 1A/1B light chain 3A-like [Stegostoma tigrinum]